MACACRERTGVCPDSTCYEDAVGGPPSPLCSGLTGESELEGAGSVKPAQVSCQCSLSLEAGRAAPSLVKCMMLVGGTLGRRLRVGFTFGARRPDAAECPASCWVWGQMLSPVSLCESKERSSLEGCWGRLNLRGSFSGRDQ